MEQKKTVLAVDLGGTKLLIGEVDSEGKVLGSKKYDSGFLKQNQAEKLIIESIIDYTETVGFAGERPNQMGVGMVGQIDADKGVWIMIDSGRRDPIPIAETLSKKFNMECRIDNDVKAATLAEQKYGAGKGIDHFVFLNIGTGIAAGMISNGKLIRGWQNDSGEVGHTTVDYNSSTKCSCGRFGCAEAIASGYGMNKRVRQFLHRYPESSLKEELVNEFIRAEKIFAAARNRDVLALKIAMDAADAASELIMNLTRMLNPRKIVLGGGIAGSDWMREELKNRLNIPCMESVLDGVVISELNPNTAGLIGAATVGLQTNVYYDKREFPHS